jgi:hypothetical protein
MSAKNLTRRALTGIGLLGLMFGGTSAQAEIVLNFPLKVDPRLSRDASSTLLYGANQIFTAVAMAEAGDRDKANFQVRAGIVQLEKARQMFLEVQKRVVGAPIDMGKVTLQKAQIDRILATHKFEFPKNTEALAQLAVVEVNRFLNTARELSFENVQRARTDTLAVSSAIARLLDVGVLVSALAEAESSAK